MYWVCGTGERVCVTLIETSGHRRNHTAVPWRISTVVIGELAKAGDGCHRMLQISLYVNSLFFMHARCQSELAQVVALLRGVGMVWMRACTVMEDLYWRGAYLHSLLTVDLEAVFVHTHFQLRLVCCVSN